jgi:hypothetical protein
MVGITPHGTSRMGEGRTSVTESRDITRARLIGLMGAVCGFPGALGDRVTGSGTLIAAIIGAGFAAMALLGAWRAERNPDRASLVLLAATIGLVLSLGWWATVAAVLLLLSAGLMVMHSRG